MLQGKEHHDIHLLKLRQSFLTAMDGKKKQHLDAKTNQTAIVCHR